MIFRLTNAQVKTNCLEYIKPLGLDMYEVEIREIKRSLPQNRYYWAILKIIGDELGYKDTDLHDACKGKFLGMEEGRDAFGNLYRKPKSTTKLTKPEFAEYMNKVLALAAEMNIAIPAPDYYGG